MASTIYSITGEWVAWTPAKASSVTTYEHLGEQRIAWGLPISGQQSYVGFLGAAPPSMDVSVGSQYTLGNLALVNRPVLGSEITSLTLEISIRFGSLTGPVSKFQLKFNYEAGATADKLTCASRLPLDISAGDLNLSFQGFSGSLEVSEAADTSVGMLFTVKSTPFEDDSCTTFTPFFHPAGCDVPAVCPIPDGPIIEDCSIPAPLNPIFDCPDLELPIGSHAGTLGASGGDGGGGGGGGNDGAPGVPGCRVVMHSDYHIFWVRDQHDVGVTVDLFECPTTTPPPGGRPDCCYRLLFTFYLYYSPLSDWSCCPFLWCDGAWKPIDDYLCDGVTPPTAIGEPGQLFYKCDCEATTTTPAPTTTAYTYNCNQEKLRWAVLICNGNASADDTFDMEVGYGGPLPLDNLADDTCASYFVQIKKTGAGDADLTTDQMDALARAVHAPINMGNVTPCDCTSDAGPTYLYFGDEHDISLADPLAVPMDPPSQDNKIVMTKTGGVANSNWGNLYVFGYTLDEAGVPTVCCIRLSTIYSGEGLAIGDTLDWMVSFYKGDCSS